MALSPITKDAIQTKAWNAIYQVIDENKSSFGVTVQTITSAYPDKTATSKNSYPIIVINPISLSQSALTFQKETVPYSCVIEIYTTRADQIDTLSSDLVYYLTANKDAFRTEARSVFESISPGTSGSFMRSGMKIHYSTIVCNFIYDYRR